MIVVVGVDESPIAELVVRRAAEEANWRDAELHVVHVLYLPAMYAQVPVDLGSVAEAQRSAVWSALDPVLADADLPVKKVDLEGYPPDSLAEYAHEVGASLLVVGTRGRGELASLILGSTSHRVIHLAGCDVLVVKPAGESSGTS